jgi:putative two-component system response regulator
MNTAIETVLIIDDEKVIRRLLRSGLTAEGYTCLEAGSAEEALALFRDHEVAVALLDITMPGKSGIELLPELKVRYPDTIVIIATASADTDTAISCLKKGAYDYFTKPFAVREVALSVGRALEKRRLEVEVRGYRQQLEQKVEEQASKIRGSFVSAVAALALALEAKDAYTNGHSQRVADISAAIAAAMGMSGPDIDKIRLAGLIHDIGKIGVRESVLNKPGRLTEEEYQHIILHCEIGERILKPIVEDRKILEMVRHHHERYDGTGYPDGLSGKRIPPGATILAVADAYSNANDNLARDEGLSRSAGILAAADAYDAMTSSRSYRGALPLEAALNEIKRGAGTQFDPEVVEACVKILSRDSSATGMDQGYTAIRGSRDRGSMSKAGRTAGGVD